MAAGSIEKVTIVLQTLTSGFVKGLGRVQTQLKTVGKNMQGFGAAFVKGLGPVQVRLKSVGKNMQEFGAVMAMPMKNFKEINDNMEATQTIGGKVAKRFRMMTHGMRGFRMEALGVMFFGMMMQRMFMNLLQPVMEAFGVFDIFRLMLLTLFLPIMETIFPWLMAMMEWFMALPEPVKKIIGIFVILGLIFGTVIMILGQFALGIGSLILFFPIFGGAIKAVGALLIGFSATALLVIAAIIVIVVAMYVAWKENFMKMKEVVVHLWDGIKRIFKGIYDVIVGTIKLVVAIFKGDWDGAAAAVKQIFMGLVNFIIGIIKAMVFAIIAIVIGIIRIFKFVVDRIVGFFKWLYNKIVGHSIIPDMINAIIDWFWKLPKAIFGMWRKIVSGMIQVGKNLVQNMIDGIKSMGRKMIDAILSLFPKWMRKGMEFAGKITVDIIESVTEKAKGVFGGGREDDFIWRPGQGAVSINPNDTLVGFKGAPPALGGGGEGVSQTNNFYGFTMDELRRELDDRDRRLVEEIRRAI